MRKSGRAAIVKKWAAPGVRGRLPPHRSIAFSRRFAIDISDATNPGPSRSSGCDAMSMTHVNVVRRRETRPAPGRQRLALDTAPSCGCNVGPELASRQRVARRLVSPMHLVDTTLFYSPTSGGVRRYLNAKHAWLASHTNWEHTLVVPGERDRTDRGGVCTLAGFTVPGTFNYRLPVNPRRWTELLAALQPSLIEAGDAFHPAWCAAHVARRRDIPLAAFYHSNLPQIIGRRTGSLSERVLSRYVRWLYERFDIVFAP